MSISANSRYASSTVVADTNLDGDDVVVILFSQPSDKNLQFTFYQITAFDFIDTIATRFYGDPRLWWVIANANPEIVNWATLTAGQFIRLPTVSSLATS